MLKTELQEHVLYFTFSMYGMSQEFQIALKKCIMSTFRWKRIYLDILQNPLQGTLPYHSTSGMGKEVSMLWWGWGLHQQ